MRINNAIIRDFASFSDVKVVISHFDICSESGSRRNGVYYRSV